VTSTDTSLNAHTRTGTGVAHVASEAKRGAAVSSSPSVSSTPSNGTAAGRLSQALDERVRLDARLPYRQEPAFPLPWHHGGLNE
jgi:hypothetical protein